jgi:hypothetical protein
MREPEQIRFAASDCTFHCSQLSYASANNACITAVTSKDYVDTVHK